MQPSERTASNVTTRQRFWPTLLLLAAFALRLYKLGGESLWYDETVSVYLAMQPALDAIAHTARDIHPPAYYLMLHLWQLIARPTVDHGLEFLYAWPSVFLGMLTVALAHTLARRCFGARAAQWTIFFAAFHPSQIWYAQETRMYALGALCVLLTLWAVTPAICDKTLPRAFNFSRSTLILYPLAALLGLYTLYYFTFWLIVFVPAVAWILRNRGHALRAWIVLQIIVVVGWLPWLPIFIRQALTPPVPPWRHSWQTLNDLLSAINEAIAAIWIGHTPPFDSLLPITVVMLIAAALFHIYAKSSATNRPILWLMLAFGPAALLILVSLLGMPLYHVRYVSTYVPLFTILLGALVANMPRSGATLLTLLFAMFSVFSLHQLWTNPLYAADDHRGAVTTLASEWRPGDVILVNAGWAYTPIAVYWPNELSSPDSFRPPAIAAYTRLHPQPLNAVSPVVDAPLIVRSGSIDGDANLGWGLPVSDFFAVSSDETRIALEQLSEQYAAIWHYRIYDTVSDPNGVIRTWLAGNTTPDYQQPIPGRDYLLLERYRTGAVITPSGATTQHDWTVRDTALQLRATSQRASISAGETLYVALQWDTSTHTNTTAIPDIAVSLRLYDAGEQQVLQKDAPISSGGAFQAGQTFALPIPANIPIGIYQSALILYAPDTLEPLAMIASDGTEISQPLFTGAIEVLPPQQR
jgi:uncharacterized membrane protein